MKIVEVSISRPIFMSMITTTLLVLGIIGYFRLGVDQMPKIDPPVITVTTVYMGAGPREIELQVSKKIEEAILQVAGIDTLQSFSKEGISRVVASFKLEVPAKDALMDVREKVGRIRRDLPDGIQEPVIQRFNYSDRPVAKYALRSKEVPESELRRIADDFVSTHLQKASGVGQINVFGGMQREIRVELELQKLELWNLSPSDVATALRNANLNVPAGNLNEVPMQRAIRIVGEYSSIGDVGSTIIKTLPGGRSLTVADVGVVKDTFKERDSIARLNGLPVVMLEVLKQSDANTVEVVDNLVEQAKSLEGKMPRNVKLEMVADNSRLIRLTIHDVVETLVIAGVLAIIVVYFFLGSLQSTLITGFALPTTILSTFFALYAFGFTLNTMTLLGLTLAVGLILDDAIVVRENIWDKIEKGLPPKQAALEGTREVFLAVLATSATVLATFLPVTLIPGIVGRFFNSFALTVCFAVIFSTFDALTMAPMLSTYLISKGAHAHRKNFVLRKFDELWHTATKGYSVLLRWCLRHRLIVVVLAIALFAVSIRLMKQVGFSFIPEQESGELEVSLEAPPGTHIEKTNAIIREMEGIIAKFPEVTLFNGTVGSTNFESNKGYIYARLVPYEDRSVTSSEMRVLFRRALAPIAMREAMKMTIAQAGGNSSGGGSRQLSFFIEGKDLDTLKSIGDSIVSEIYRQVPGVVDLQSSMREGQSEMEFQVNRERLTAFQLSVGQVGDYLTGLINGIVATKYREDGDEYDLRVQLDDKSRADSAKIRSLKIPNSRGELIPLEAITSHRSGFSPAQITRVDDARGVSVDGDLSPGYPLAQVIESVRRVVKSVLPPGYTVEFQGQAKNLNDLATGGLLALSLAVLFIYMIMASLYESLVLPFSILLTLPLASVGAIFGLLLTGKFIDIYSMIGIILLMGLVTKNAILVIDYVEQLRAAGKERMEAIMEGGVRRFKPVAMTTLAMIAGMIPVAAGWGEINKSRAGMGVVAIGGLLSSTLLSLVVVPCAYVYFDNLRVFSQYLLRRMQKKADASSKE